MTRKHGKRKPKAAEKAAVPSTPPLSPQSTQSVKLDEPPLDYLVKLARAEDKKINLSQYSEVICTLREEKQFTFREIAAWLKEQGVIADYNGVYRVYTRHLSDEDSHQVAQEDEEREL